MDSEVTVFLLEHVKGFENDYKTIGVFSSRESAERAIERLRLQPGFRDVPDGFTIDAYHLDESCWDEGYISTPIPFDP